THRSCPRPRRSCPRPFFFASSLDLRHLHSFPTRRSSDLLNGQVALVDFREANPPRLVGGNLSVLQPVAAGILIKIDAGVGSLIRSEEHTSELQSQSNLVCRLLLEKKKKEHRAHGRCDTID